MYVTSRESPWGGLRNGTAGGPGTGGGTPVAEAIAEREAIFLTGGSSGRPGLRRRAPRRGACAPVRQPGLGLPVRGGFRGTGFRVLGRRPPGWRPWQHLCYLRPSMSPMVLRGLMLLLAVVLTVGPSLCLLDGNPDHGGSPCHLSLAGPGLGPSSAEPPGTGPEGPELTLSPIAPLDRLAPPPKA